MYINRQDIIKALTTMIGEEYSMPKTQKRLENMLLHDGDVDEYDARTRMELAKVIDAVLEDLPSVLEDLQGWSDALKGEGQDEIDELAKRAGL